MSDDLYAIDAPEMCRRCAERAYCEHATEGQERPWNELVGGLTWEEAWEKAWEEKKAQQAAQQKK
eukprot:SAG25_NODE_7632_length_469_cov_55.664865_1_plen_65_part_00